MEKIAFIIGDRFLYWSPLILALAVIAAVCAFIALHLSMGGRVLGTAVVLPMAFVFSFVLGRIVIWYCRPDSYESFAAAITDISGGGFALTGVVAGVLLALCIARLTGALEDLPKALDCASLAGLLGICVGRFNHLFNSGDRGIEVGTFTGLPMAYPVVNASTGESELRLATFMLQAIVAGIIFAALLTVYILGRNKKSLRNGDICLLAMLCYGASQVIMDSTRYDALFLRSNGFVSMVQILGAVMVAVTIVLFSIRMVKANGFKWWFVACWVGVAGLLTCAGIMEYYVQRRGNEAYIFYNVMAASLVAVVAIGVVIRWLAVAGERAKEAKIEQNEE